MSIIDERSLAKQHEMPSPETSTVRSTLQVRSYIFVGYSGGFLQKLDSETLELLSEIKLHSHIFYIEQFDEEHIICG